MMLARLATSAKVPPPSLMVGVGAAVARVVIV